MPPMIGAVGFHTHTAIASQGISAARSLESEASSDTPLSVRENAKNGNSNAPPTGKISPAALSGPNALIALQAKESNDNEGKTDSKHIGKLSEEEQSQVKALKTRDREVRAHESAHAAAGAGIAGSPSFTYQVGPDGQRYAVAGEVAISTGGVDGDPEATIRKLEQVVRAALAPAQPSGQDRAVAAQAKAQILQARADAAAARREEFEATTSDETKAGETVPGKILSLVA